MKIDTESQPEPTRNPQEGAKCDRFTPSLSARKRRSLLLIGLRLNPHAVDLERLADRMCTVYAREYDPCRGGKVCCARGIARGLAHNDARRDLRFAARCASDQVLLGLPDRSIPTPDEYAVKSIDGGALWEEVGTAFAALPHVDQLILEGYFWDDLGYKAIQNRLHELGFFLSESAVKTRGFRAIRKLRRKLVHLKPFDA